jgi:hypothetical protein
MSTNYYLLKNRCPHCGREEERLHIGKSSVGWCFSLHVIPGAGINDLCDWKKLFVGGSAIVDEYDNETTPDEMQAVITSRRFLSEPADDCSVIKALGYKSRDEFYKKNNCIQGPNGLLRHILDGSHCVKHGEGAWDCITGEFS